MRMVSSMSYVQLKSRSTRLVSLIMGLALIGSACAEPSSISPETSTTTTVDASTSDAPPSGAAEEPSDTDQSSTEDAASASDESVSTTVNAAADPLPVTFSEETGAASTVEIGPEGGDVTAISDDGTTYVLTVPEGALLGTEQITITPVSLNASPFENATAHGISMEPDGLVFLEVATLEISGGEFDPAISVAYSSEHDGGDFRAQAATVGETVSFPVAHFSMGGMIVAAESEVASIFDEYSPRSREGRHVQEIAVINRRVEDLDARGSALGGVLETWFREIHSEVSTTADGPALDQLLGEYINARGYLALLRDADGGEAIGPAVDEAMVDAALALQEAAGRMFDQANLRCIQDREPEGMFAMLKWALLYLWIGGDFTGGGLRWEEMSAAIKRCASFRVEFVSNASASFDSVVDANVPLELQNDLDASSGVLRYPVVRGTLNGQGVAGKLACGSQAPIDVTAELYFNPTIGHISETQFDGLLVPIRFYEETNWVCGGQAIQQALWLPFFATAFASYRSGDGFFLFETKPSSAAGVWADATGASSSDGVHVTFDVRLIHEPQLP